MNAFQLTVAFALLSLKGYAQELGCDVSGHLIDDSLSLCSYSSRDIVTEIYVEGGSEKVRPSFDGDFRIGWTALGTQELCVVHYNCYTFDRMYMDTLRIEFECEVDRIESIDILVESECPFDEEEKTCPVCNKKDESIPIVYKRTTDRLRRKSSKKKIVLGGENGTPCKPHWYCLRDERSF